MKNRCIYVYTTKTVARVAVRAKWRRCCAVLCEGCDFVDVERRRSATGLLRQHVRPQQLQARPTSAPSRRVRRRLIVVVAAIHSSR